MNSTWYDLRELTRCLSAKKINNIRRLYTSYQLSQKTGRVRHLGNPMALSIEPTTACNLRCPECPSGLRSFSRPTGNIKADTFTTILDELAEDLLYLILYFQGEPLIHPRFSQMIHEAHSRQLYTITSTNGHFLSPSVCEDVVRSGLSRIIISVDGATQESYAQYRKGGQLEQVLTGIKTLVDTRRQLKSKTPYIVFQTIAFRSNEHELQQLKNLAQNLGVDRWSLKTAQVYHENNPSARERLPQNPSLTRYEKENLKLKNHSRTDNSCWRMWHSAVVTWDGTVVPCCFDKDAEMALGNIHENSFRKIWHNNGYENLRKSIFRDRKSIQICKNCSEGCKIWVNPKEIM